MRVQLPTLLLTLLTLTLTLVLTPQTSEGIPVISQCLPERDLPAYRVEKQDSDQTIWLDMAVIDLSNDGTPDVLLRGFSFSAGFQSIIRVYPNEGGVAGSFNASHAVAVVPPAFSSLLGLPDVDNDGLPDIVYRSSAKEIRWMRNLGNGPTICEKSLVKRNRKSSLRITRTPSLRS